MSAKVQRLHLRLFAEGVEIPCISAQVQVNPNSPMMASIQIPPLAEATRFLPRTLIHLFFLELYDAENPNITLTGTSVTKAPGPTTYEKENSPGEINGVIDADALVRDARNQKYKLLFVGEVMGFSWTKNAVNRSIVLQCADLSNYWDYAFQFNNSDLFGPSMKAMFSGGSTNLFTDFLSSPGEMIVGLLHQPPTRYPGMKGLLGGIIHVLEAMGGSYFYDKKYAGQNIFFSIAELRLRITQMLTAYDKDPTASKLLGGGYDALFGRSIGNLGEQASFRKVISMLTSTIFHEVYPQPCPYYTPGTSGTLTGFVRKKIGDIRLGSSLPFDGIVTKSLSMSLSLLSILSDITKIFEDKDAKEKVKGVILQAGVPGRIQDIQRMCNEQAKAANAVVPTAKKMGAPTVAAVAAQAAGLFRSAASSLGVALSRSKAKGSGTAKNSADIRSLLESAESSISRVRELEANLTKPKEAIPASLKQQIFRPDVWFSAPPRCNVLFPDQYSSLNYARQFMAEPTRLMLKTHDEFFGEDELFDNFYFAPKAITLKGEQNTLQAILKGDILNHELFTGIIPVFEKMGEFNIFAARSGMVNGKTPKVGLAQRSTNFLYFKYRFAPRQLQVAGRFNPYIACGFPGLIVDKYVDLQTFKLHNELLKSLPNGATFPQRDLTKMLGTHFLGSFTEVTHQVDQQQGTTMINCSYARQAEESVEFLGASQDEVIMKKQSGPPAVVITEVAAVTPPRVNSQGPGLGRIIEVKDITSKYVGPSVSFETAKKLPVFGGQRDKRTKQLTSKAVVGFPAVASDYGPDIVALVGDANIAVTFRAYEVREEKTRTKREVVDLPPEEYIRPGWYGDCWHPAKISEVYYDFFNTGAITEATQAQNVIRADVALLDQYASSDAQTSLAELQESDNPETFARDQLIALALTKDANIEQAVAFLVLTYSVIKHGGFDTDQFIRSYVWRPIASMLDIFGSNDLLLDTSGKDVVNGIEGFHSRASGPYEDLFGLVTNDIEDVLGIKKGATQAQKADTRKRKYDAVLNYVAAVRLSRAILGLASFVRLTVVKLCSICQHWRPSVMVFCLNCLSFLPLKRGYSEKQERAGIRPNLGRDGVLCAWEHFFKRRRMVLWEAISWPNRNPSFLLPMA